MQKNVQVVAFKVIKYCPAAVTSIQNWFFAYQNDKIMLTTTATKILHKHIFSNKDMTTFESFCIDYQVKWITLIILLLVGQQ